MNSLTSENFPLLGQIDPAALAVGTTDSDYAHMGKFGRVMGEAAVGTISATQTVTVSMIQATDSSGSGAKAITGKAATGLVNADDNKQVQINVRADELDMDNNFDYCALRIVVADTASPVATVTASGTVHGDDARYEPGSDNDLASVAEIVT